MRRSTRQRQSKQRSGRTTNISGRRINRRQVTVIQRPPLLRSMERKWHTHVINSVVVGQPFTLIGDNLNPVNGIAQGNGDNMRDGRQCVMTSIHFKLNVQQDTLYNQGAGFSNNGPQTVRIVGIIDDIVTSANSPLNSNLFDMSAGSPATGTQQYRNLLHTNKYRVLFDKTIYLNRPWGGNNASELAPQEFAPQVNKIVTINKSFKKPMLLEFSGNNTLYASMTRNAISVYASRVTDAQDIKVSMNCRVRFAEK